jgi:hypothetical protein
MVRNGLAVAFHGPLQPIFDFAESAHAAKYARRIGDFPARNATLFKLTPLPATLVRVVQHISRHKTGEHRCHNQTEPQLAIGRAADSNMASLVREPR